jgi:hypothetical protein
MAKRKKTTKNKLTRGPWKAKDLALLKRLFANTPTAAISKKLQRPNDAVKKKASRMRLRKSNKYLKSIGRA